MEASALTDRLTMELFRTGEFRVLEREMLDRILSEQEFQLSGCTSTECLVEIGQLVGVEQIVSGSVSKIGNVFSISARLISVESGEILNVAFFDYDGSIGELVKIGMRDVAEQLSTAEEPASESIPAEEPEPEVTTDEVVEMMNRLALEAQQQSTLPVQKKSWRRWDYKKFSMSPSAGIKLSDIAAPTFGGNISWQLNQRNKLGVDIALGEGSAVRDSADTYELSTFSVYLSYEFLILKSFGFELSAGYHEGDFQSLVFYGSPFDFEADNYDLSPFGAKAGFVAHIPGDPSLISFTPYANIEMMWGFNVMWGLNVGLRADLNLF